MTNHKQKSVDEIVDRLFDGLNFSPFAKSEIKSAILEAVAAEKKRADEAIATCAAMREALSLYGNHLDDCPSSVVDTKDSICRCGYREALSPTIGQELLERPAKPI